MSSLKNKTPKKINKIKKSINMSYRKKKRKGKKIDLESHVKKKKNE